MKTKLGNIVRSTTGALLIVCTLSGAFIFNAYSESMPMKKGPAGKAQPDDTDDKNLITGAIMRESDMYSYCLNISDAAIELRSVILNEELKTVESQAKNKLMLIESKIQELKKWTLKRDKFLKSGNDALVKVFQTMRPDSAALQMTELESALAAAIIFKLEPKYSSAILSEMKPAVAAKIAVILTSAVDENETQ